MNSDIFGAAVAFAGGVLILLLKPFKVGDYIKEDTNGNESSEYGNRSGPDPCR